MLATIASATLSGWPARPSPSRSTSRTGCPASPSSGLPDASCREARDRVRAALLSSGLSWPTQRVTVNLAPTGVRKSGAGLDLAIAIGLLVADEQVPARCRRRGRPSSASSGSTARSGPCPARCPLVDALDVETVVVVPPARRSRRSWWAATWCAPRATLTELLACLVRRRALAARCPSPDELPPLPDPARPGRRAWPAHRPPGARGGGRRWPPPADDRAAGLGQDDAGPAAGRACCPTSSCPTRSRPPGSTRPPGVALPPGRAGPAAAVPGPAPRRLVGGHGRWRRRRRLRPGEISIASGGVLFLDELGEFHADVLDALRQPLEEGAVRVARADVRVTLPARFLLVGGHEPVPCGEGGMPGGCRCSDASMARYAPASVRAPGRPLRPAHPGAPARPGRLLAGPPGESTAVGGRAGRAARERAGPERACGATPSCRRRPRRACAPLTREAPATCSSGSLRERAAQRPGPATACAGWR